MRKSEWCFKWATLAFVAGVVLAVSTATADDGVRWALRQWLINLWSMT
jgi:hypothetical protein